MKKDNFKEKVPAMLVVWEQRFMRIRPGQLSE
jgi:hypothetical protein